MSQCCEHVHKSGVAQTLDEMEWERGLWGAAHGGDVDKVTTLLKKGRQVDERDNSGYTALHYAARNGHTKVCQILLRNGADVNAITKEGHSTALQRAAFTGKEDVVKLLLEWKADTTHQDADGKTALHRAAEGQHSAVCKLLVESKPELRNIEDNRGQLPVHYALSNILIEILNSH